MRNAILEHAPADSSREWQFLIDCLATQCAGGADTRPVSFDARGLDWKKVIRSAEVNCVAPLLASAIITHGVQGLSEFDINDLKNRYRHSSQRGMEFAIELRGILAALKKAHIRCIPLKGPMLAVGSYGKLGMRDYSDLDLLIATEDVPAAAAAMAQIGYQGWGIPQQWIESHLRTESEHNLTCPSRGFVVDLHWAVGRKYFTMPVDFNEYWARSSRTRLIGSPVADFSPEDLVLYLCYHGGRHLFGRLSWICDVAATVARHPTLDWDQILSRAAAAGARRLLLLGLGLSQQLFNTRLPSQIRRAIAADTTLKPLGAEILRDTFHAKAGSTTLRHQVEAALFHLRVRERLFDRARYVFWAAMPNTRDRGDSCLPPALGFLLMVTRPFRLLKKGLIDRRRQSLSVA